eukprot:scaffold3175_cov68-Phaeocystis_antarctica.AAC.1
MYLFILYTAWTFRYIHQTKLQCDCGADARRFRGDGCVRKHWAKTKRELPPPRRANETNPRRANETKNPFTSKHPLRRKSLALKRESVSRVGPQRCVCGSTRPRAHHRVGVKQILSRAAASFYHFTANIASNVYPPCPDFTILQSIRTDAPTSNRIHRCSHQCPQISPAIPTLTHSSSGTASPRSSASRSSRVFSPTRTRPPRPCSLPPRLPPTCCLRARRRARTFSAGRPPTQPCQQPCQLPLLPRSCRALLASPAATVAAAAATAAEDGATPAAAATPAAPATPIAPAAPATP